MVMNPSKVAGHTRYLLESFNDSEVDSIAQEICQVHLIIGPEVMLIIIWK